jgi:hypothetical protein
MVVNLKLSAGFVQSKIFLPGLRSFVVHCCSALLYSCSNGELFFKANAIQVGVVFILVYCANTYVLGCIEVMGYF